MDSALTVVVITSVSVSIITPVVSWLVTRRATNSRVKVDQFTAITDALQAQIADQGGKITALEAKVAARDEALEQSKAENLSLRETVVTLKGTVQRYLQSVADAWMRGGRMPAPDPRDLAWLELTIPEAAPAASAEKEETQ
jgi:hypothetical protein